MTTNNTQSQEDPTVWWRYVQELIGDDAHITAARRAGIDPSAFSRWKRGAATDAGTAVKLARAYGADVPRTLVAAGVITAKEASTGRGETAARTAAIRAAVNALADASEARARAVREVARLVAFTDDEEIVAGTARDALLALRDPVSYRRARGCGRGLREDVPGE